MAQLPTLWYPSMGSGKRKALILPSRRPPLKISKVWSNRRPRVGLKDITKNPKLGEREGGDRGKVEREEVNKRINKRVNKQAALSHIIVRESNKLSSDPGIEEEIAWLNKKWALCDPSNEERESPSCGLK
ncbi:hypothetical protein M0802_007375 [Mischocyttarus mexicanus]|nr:hypothetical protein M0802_007375 [Mischocyttarus mexicanus]